jgi:broad specificity phosphatase PhoE
MKIMLNRIKQKLETREVPNHINFWFVRHAQSEANVEGFNSPVMHDTPITSTGILEAHAIATYFKTNHTPISSIYSSPLMRTYQTAEIIGRELNIPVKTKEGLKERDWGIWAGLPWNDVSQKLSGLTLEERFKFVPPEGESWEQMDERLAKTLEEVAEDQNSGENTLIITHRGCLRAILPVLAKAGRDKHEDFSVGTGTLTKFSFDQEAFDFVGLTPEKW